MTSPQSFAIHETFPREHVHSVRGGSLPPARGPALAKHGCRVEFPKTRKDALSAIKREAFRLGRNGTRQGFEFAQRLFRAIPELGRE